jgi:hypothetical protein
VEVVLAVVMAPGVKGRVLVVVLVMVVMEMKAGVAQLTTTPMMNQWVWVASVIQTVVLAMRVVGVAGLGPEEQTEGTTLLAKGTPVRLVMKTMDMSKV